MLERLKDIINFEVTDSQKKMDALNMAIKALEQELCNEDAVSREFMYKLGAKCIAARNENGVLVAISSIDSLPSVNPQEKTGHWIKMDEGFSPYECSVCSSIEFIESNYCPNCGAMMREVEE